MPQLDIIFNPLKFPDFLEKIEDLCKISDTIKIKIDNDDIFMYSMMGENVILSFKSYILPIAEYIEMDPMENIFNVVIPNSKKFAKSLSFISTSDKIKCNIDYKEDDGTYNSRFIQIKSGKLKISSGCAEQNEIRDLTKESLLQNLDTKNQKWSFVVSKEDFQDIKKLSSINSNGKIINIDTSAGEVIMSEPSSWEMKVGNSNEENKHLLINKSCLSNINDSGDQINFYVFGSFLMVRDSNSHLMISFEQNFED